MKKIYFQTTASLRDFMDLCKSNNISFNLPSGKGLLLCIEIPDDFKSDEFCNKYGFD